MPQPITSCYQYNIGLRFTEAACQPAPHPAVAVGDKLQAIQADFEQRCGIRVAHLALDLSQPGAATTLYAWCHDQALMVDYLVNNAGYGDYGPVAQGGPARCENLLALNVVTLTTLTTLFVKDVVARRSGRILNIGSLAAFQSVPQLAVTMIKFAILLRKRADLSHDEFVQYHKTQHAPLFMSLPEVQQYVRRYVQGHTLPLDLPGLPAPAYDGTAGLWFDALEDIAKVFTAEDYMRLIRPDEAKFLDLPGCGFLVLAENPVFEG